MKPDPAPETESEAVSESPTFEDSVSELQDIVGHLEDGSLPLNESMLQFERGVALLRNCYQVLEQAEQRIELLTGMNDDVPKTQPFDGSSTLEQQAAESQESPATPKRTTAKRRSPRDDATSLF